MKINILSAVILFGAMTGVAQARNDPTPPPSGIVIHVFGPGSITSNILPGTGAAAPAGAPARASAAAPGVAPASGNAVAAQPAYQEPTLGQVVHQMFVVGDPTKTAQERQPVGRTADHP